MSKKAGIEYSPKIAQEIIVYRSMGWTMDEISEQIGVSTQTLYKWAKTNLKLKVALECATHAADGKMINALYLAGVAGYDKPMEEVVEEYDGDGILIKKKVTTKTVFIPPNVNAQKLWLQSRHPEFKPQSNVDVNHSGAIPIINIIPASVQTGKKQLEEPELYEDEE